MYVPPLASEHRRIFKEILFLFDHEDFKMKFYDINNDILWINGHDDAYIISCSAFYMLEKHGVVSSGEKLRSITCIGARSKDYF